MLLSAQITAFIDRTVFGIQKIPHSTSIPVIRKEDGTFTLAVFTFFYNKQDIESGMISRPELWVTADIETGKVLNVYKCSEKDFSSASFGTKYNIRMSSPAIPRDHFTKMYALLDELRTDIINGKDFDYDKYQTYINMVISTIPDDYRQFFTELGKIS